jgi:hypothetical protein
MQQGHTPSLGVRASRLQQRRQATHGERDVQLHMKQLRFGKSMIHEWGLYAEVRSRLPTLPCLFWVGFVAAVAVLLLLLLLVGGGVCVMVN